MSGYTVTAKGYNGWWGAIASDDPSWLAWPLSRVWDEATQARGPYLVFPAASEDEARALDTEEHVRALGFDPHVGYMTTDPDPDPQDMPDLYPLLDPQRQIAHAVSMFDGRMHHGGDDIVFAVIGFFHSNGYYVTPSQIEDIKRVTDHWQIGETA